MKATTFKTGLVAIFDALALSLIVKNQGWLESQGVNVNWVQPAGSNKANEGLRAGAIDVGSAALLPRSKGSPIQTIAIYSCTSRLVGVNREKSQKFSRSAAK